MKKDLKWDMMKSHYVFKTVPAKYTEVAVAVDLPGDQSALYWYIISFPPSRPIYSLSIPCLVSPILYKAKAATNAAPANMPAVSTLKPALPVAVVVAELLTDDAADPTAEVTDATIDEAEAIAPLTDAEAEATAPAPSSILHTLSVTIVITVSHVSNQSYFGALIEGVYVRGRSVAGHPAVIHGMAALVMASLAGPHWQA